MTKLSGSCLCGAVSYEGDTEIKMTINCHCTDCQKITGSMHGTMIFVQESDVTVSGSPKSFEHKADSGNVLTKLFCESCGSQMMGKNTMRPGVIGVRVGTLDQKNQINPTVNIYCDSAIPSTSMDPELKSFPKMPG